MQITQVEALEVFLGGKTQIETVGAYNISSLPNLRL